MALDWGDDFTLVGASVAEANSISIPTHQAGDVIVIFAFNDGSTTNPSIPSGASWTTITNTLDGSSCSASCAWKIATGSGTTSGTWTNATGIAVYVARPKSGATVTRPTSASATGTGTSVTWPLHNFQGNTAKNRAVTFIGHRSTDVSLGPRTAGFTFTQQAHTSSESNNTMAVHDTNNTALTNLSSTSVAHGGTSSGYIVLELEFHCLYVTSWYYPTSAVNSDYYGSRDWDYASRATSDDTDYAQCGPFNDPDGYGDETDYIISTSYNVSLPANAEPVGMIYGTAMMDTNDYAGDAKIEIWLNSTAGTLQSPGQTRWAWTFFSSGSLWTLPNRPGGGSWTKSDVESSGFGIRSRIHVAQYVVDEYFFINYSAIQIAYALPASSNHSFWWAFP